MPARRHLFIASPTQMPMQGILQEKYISENALILK
jgi:hypothetical protein